MSRGLLPLSGLAPSQLNATRLVKHWLRRAALGELRPPVVEPVIGGERWCPLMDCTLDPGSNTLTLTYIDIEDEGHVEVRHVTLNGVTIVREGGTEMMFETESTSGRIIRGKEMQSGVTPPQF